MVVKYSFVRIHLSDVLGGHFAWIDVAVAATKKGDGDLFQVCLDVCVEMCEGYDLNAG